VPGAAAPKVLSREMVRSMGRARIVDVSIDQGGASETSRPTTHSSPIYIDEGVIHYCVSNMPGAVPQTSTQALTSATLPYIEAIAKKGVEGALQADPALAQSLSTWKGTLVRGPVAETCLPLNAPGTPPSPASSRTPPPARAPAGSGRGWRSRGW
jgi:alanine dehydrogenase